MFIWKQSRQLAQQISRNGDDATNPKVTADEYTRYDTADP